MARIFPSSTYCHNVYILGIDFFFSIKILIPYHLTEYYRQLLDIVIIPLSPLPLIVLTPFGMCFECFCHFWGFTITAKSLTLDLLNYLSTEDINKLKK